MKKLLLLMVLAVIGYASYSHRGPDTSASAPADTMQADPLGDATSGQQVQGVGVVIKILSDDNEGSRHQRFILRLPSGQTLLVAHNIDLAPRIANLSAGDRVEYKGEFEANDKGGVVHWTHRDPANRHVSGWLKHDGRLFQ